MEKQYLDYEGFEHTIERLRRKEMPTASVDYVGQIVQYVGSTNSDYVKGYYYECVSDGETPATYSWVQRDIQPKESVKFNVLNYGVKRGNYPEDNRDAFAQLLADVPNGATIYFPYGEYIFAPMNGTFSLTKDLYIVGDGLDLSIIKYKFQDTTGHHALSLNGGDVDFMLKDICMEIDFDSGDNIPSAEGQLIKLIGTFNNILIDRVYLHTGGNLDPASMPTYNLIYSKAGCNNFEVSECVFEALLNRHYGGCIWFSPYLRTSDEVLARVIDTLRIHDNLFRTTNGDEVIAVWEGGDATAHGVIKHCFIYDNTIYHDDFNGTSFPTANIIAVYQNRGVEESIDCKITNNNILVKRSSGSSIIKIIGYNGVDVINNTIKIYDYCQTESSQTFMRIFAIEDEAVVNIKDNKLISNVTTHDLWLTSGKRGVSYVGNKIIAKNPNTYFVSPQVEVATEDMNLSIVRNDIVIDSSATNAKLVLYLAGTPTDAELRKVTFIDNHVDGVSSLTAYLHGGKLYFKNNSSSKRLKYTHDYSQGANLVEWEDNGNIEFNSLSATPTYKIDTFVYHGYFDDLVFTNQQDSEETRNKYFNEHKITYFDKSSDDVYKVLGKMDIIEDFSDAPADAVSVMDYGAKADGVTDDSAAFIAAIASSSTYIKVPRGVYNMNHVEVTFPAGVTFIGESPKLSVILNSNITATSGITIKNIAFDGGTDRKITTGGFFKGIHNTILYNTPSVDSPIHLENCIFKNADVASFAVSVYDNTPGFTSDIVRGCYFESLKEGGVYHVCKGGSALYENNVFKNLGDLTTTKYKIGIWSGDTTNVSSNNVNDCIVRNNVFDTLLTPNRTDSSQSHNEAGNFIATYADHILIYGNTCKNIVGYGTDREGIYTKGNFVDIHGNYLENAGLGEGYICCKQQHVTTSQSKSHKKIYNNILVGDAGRGIAMYGDCEITGNHIHIINAKNAIVVSCYTNGTEDVLIHDNDIRVGIDSFSVDGVEITNYHLWGFNFPEGIIRVQDSRRLSIKNNLIQAYNLLSEIITGVYIQVPHLCVECSDNSISSSGASDRGIYVHCTNNSGGTTLTDIIDLDFMIDGNVFDVSDYSVYLDARVPNDIPKKYSLINNRFLQTPTTHFVYRITNGSNTGNSKLIFNSQEVERIPSNYIQANVDDVEIDNILWVYR